MRNINFNIRISKFHNFIRKRQVYEKLCGYANFALLDLLTKKYTLFRLNSNCRFHYLDARKGARLSFFGSIGAGLRTRLQNTKEFYLFVMQFFVKH